jgi:hypothetical protein
MRRPSGSHCGVLTWLPTAGAITWKVPVARFQISSWPDSVV